MEREDALTLCCLLLPAPTLSPSFVLQTPNPPQTYPHTDSSSSEPSPMCPAGYFFWDVSPSHCPHQVQRQICHLPLNDPLLHPHLSSTARLVTQARPPGIMPDTHPMPSTGQSPVPLGPPSPLSSGRSISHLSTWSRNGYWALTLCQKQIARAMAVAKPAESLQRASRPVGRAPWT